MKNLDNLFLKILSISKIDRHLFINYEHDAALLNWFEEKKRLGIDEFFLITIDDHIDLTFLEENTINILKEYRESFETLTKEQLNKLILSEFHGHSVSFITAAMELGIVSDVLIISPNHNRFRWRDNKEISHRRLRCLKTKFEIYSDSSGEEHNVYFIPYMHHLGGGNKGIMTDIVDKKKIELANQILSSDLIIDIDLDYCTYPRDFKTFVIAYQNFKWEFENEIFINLLLNRANVISLSLEPLYCGGESNCKEISSYFGYLFQYSGIIDHSDVLNQAVARILEKSNES